jgi:hypothetical protein
MNVSELKVSKFLRKEDCDPAILVTIEGVHQENVAKDGAPEEMKWVMRLKETEKPLVLNSTNGQIIAQITGSPESDAWTGTKIVLYHDPSISFGGKLVGGVRVRAPRKPPVPVVGKKPVLPPAPVEEPPTEAELAAPGEDGLPF